jgi:quinol-cytochrome oxidoreductase complex cytochrome b subunit
MEGEVVGAYAIGVAGLFFFLVPFWDRWAVKGQRHWFVTTVGVVAVLYLATMTLLAYIKPY